MSTVRRRLLIWQAVHDNGWISVIAEQSDGTFVAWAGVADSSGVDCIEDTPEHAKAAALVALQRKSGHATCSQQCSGWEMHALEPIVVAPETSPPDTSRRRPRRLS